MQIKRSNITRVILKISENLIKKQIKKNNGSQSPIK